jgi:hypothetical protein
MLFSSVLAADKKRVDLLCKYSYLPLADNVQSCLPSQGGNIKADELIRSSAETPVPN